MHHRVVNEIKGVGQISERAVYLAAWHLDISPQQHSEHEERKLQRPEIKLGIDDKLSALDYEAPTASNDCYQRKKKDSPGDEFSIEGQHRSNGIKHDFHADRPCRRNKKVGIAAFHHKDEILTNQEDVRKDDEPGPWNFAFEGAHGSPLVPGEGKPSKSHQGYRPIRGQKSYRSVGIESPKSVFIRADKNFLHVVPGDDKEQLHGKSRVKRSWNPCVTEHHGEREEEADVSHFYKEGGTSVEPLSPTCAQSLPILADWKSLPLNGSMDMQISHRSPDADARSG